MAESPVTTEEDNIYLDATQKPLSAALKARIERNRQKALLLKQSRLVEKGAKENEGIYFLFFYSSLRHGL